MRLGAEVNTPIGLGRFKGYLHKKGNPSKMLIRLRDFPNANLQIILLYAFKREEVKTI